MGKISEQLDVVSFPSEQLILVDSDDNTLGYRSKVDCHDGHGILHRAFSLFVFNSEGQVLLQQRSKDKRLWPGYWANTCCSHPRRGESMQEAINRRLDEEMGLRCELTYLYKFEYQADFGNIGAEHELCSVFVGLSDAVVRPNMSEVDAWRFLDPEALDRAVVDEPTFFTPWLKMEWAKLRRDFNQVLRDLPKSRDELRNL